MVASKKASPGPGVYFPRTTNNGSPAFTFGKRAPAPNRASAGTPGPAEYFPSQNGHSPAFSMGKKAPPLFDEGTPGPGSYFVLTHPLSNAHSPAFTLATRPFAAAASARKFDDASPGPGSYEITSSCFCGPKFSIRTRKPVVIKDPLPGPGSYFVDHSQASSPSPLCHHHRPQDL